MRGQPPGDKEFSPERLFRLLIAAPRPTLPIASRIAGLSGALSVRAPLSRDALEIIDAARDNREATARIVAAALLYDGQPAFASVEEFGTLTLPEADEIIRDASHALDVIAPVIGRCDGVAWHIKLCIGAKHHTNAAACRALGTAYEVHSGLKHARVVERPERYFGVPLCELTDGHWLAFRAARAVIEESFT